VLAIVNKATPQDLTEATNKNMHLFATQVGALHGHACGVSWMKRLYQHQGRCIVVQELHRGC